MIRKLMKYDLKDMLRVLVYLYIACLGLAVITRLFTIGEDILILYIFAQIFKNLTYSAIIATIINMARWILATFTGPLYKDRSYLTHTLPVKKSQILDAKYLSSFVVIFLTTLVSFASLVIIFYSNTFMVTVKALLATSIAGINMSMGLMLGLLALVVLAEVCAMMSMGFSAIIIGHRQNRNKTGSSVLWFFVLYMLSTIVTLVVSIIVGGIAGILPQMFGSVMTQGVFMVVLITALVCYFGFSVAFYFISKKLFNKGVNVD